MMLLNGDDHTTTLIHAALLMLPTLAASFSAIPEKITDRKRPRKSAELLQ
jgi:hypothetical protein